MLSLYNSERFQTEIKTYNEQISKIDDLKIKSLLETNLKQLVSHVKHLDSTHEHMIFTKQVKEMSGDNRNKITEIRKLLDRTIKDYFSINKN